ncbi:helix-turn-helix domain-containing protein [Rhizobium lusitanum]|uniref:Helix-turn-helix domain-containing protein n=2 Tax=Rhizobium lusitanum TaxID=293958 RepID=A0A6L9UCA4_9HYPH|nr:helix-turn-helix domain-containing protein [Rhizobium lusitanum]
MPDSDRVKVWRRGIPRLRGLMEKNDASEGSAPLARAAQIVDVVAANKGGLTLKKISEAVGLAPSTTHRMVNSLVAIGYLASREQDKTYELGQRLIRVMHMAFGSRNIQTLSDPILTRLLRQFGQVSYVNQLVGNKVRLVAFATPERMDRTLVVPGEASPIHATASGKAIFAFQDAAIVDRELSLPLQKYLPNTIVDPAAIREELAEVRVRGYAITKSEFDLGVTALAVPIEIPIAGVVFSIGMTGFENQMFSEASLDQYVLALSEAAEELKPVLSFVGHAEL